MDILRFDHKNILLTHLLETNGILVFSAIVLETNSLAAAF